MPQVVVAVLTAFEMIGAALTVGAVTGVAAIAIGGLLVVSAGMMAYKFASMSAVDYSVANNDKSRQTTVKSTVEPQKIIYGEALVSGPLTFVGVSGNNNEILRHVIALAGHEVHAITDIWLDDEIILNNQFNIGGGVISGTFSGIVSVTKYLGTPTQQADQDLVLTYGGYTQNHDGKEIAYIHTRFTLTDQSAEVWDKYSPSSIKAIVQGKKTYDPRLDTSPGANPTNATYMAYSDNPALAVADYLMNSKYGMGISPSKIDWPAVVTSANACDVLVTIPTGTEKRFTANGVLFATDTHKANIERLVGAMNGKLVYSSGMYYIKAGIYEAPTESLDENDLNGSITVKTSFERSERFNTVGGMFIDPAQLHKSSEFPKVSLASAVSRDNGEVLEREIELPFTNSSFMAQRIAHKMIQLSSQQKVITFPANLAGLRISVGDRVSVSVEELGWTNKVFECLGWTFNDGGDDGVNLTLREDDINSYSDTITYSTISADGTINDGFAGVPSISGLSAIGSRKSLVGIDISWVNPTNIKLFNRVEVWSSTAATPTNFTKVGDGLFNTFTHDSANSADPLSLGDQRWYWVRCAYGQSLGSFIAPVNAIATENIPDDGVTAEKLDDNAVIFAPSGLFVQWTWDGTNKSPTSSTQDVPVVFTNLTGSAVGGTTTLRFTFVNSTTITVAEFGDNTDTVVSTYEGGATGDGYVVAKVEHTASGVSAYVQGTIYSTGGSGGK